MPPSILLQPKFENQLMCKGRWQEKEGRNKRTTKQPENNLI
jgi:hypothetical protein